jgi:hypothetical protein
MSLHLKYSYDGIEKQLEATFYVGGGWVKSYAHFEIMSIYSVQADGDELEKIKQQFSNLRMTTNRVVFWTGEDAQFIVDNLKL